LVLVKQSSSRQDAGQYVSPIGGHVKAGEAIENALKREAFVLNRQENHFFVQFEISSDEDLKLNHESVEYRKFTSDQLNRELKQNPKLFGDSFHFVAKTSYPELLI